MGGKAKPIKDDVSSVGCSTLLVHLSGYAICAGNSLETLSASSMFLEAAS